MIFCITLSVNSLHLENGLELYFNEWNVRNQHVKKSIECDLGYASCANWHNARPDSDVIKFYVDVTTCVALFLTIIIHLKTFEESTSPRISKKSVLLQ